MIDGHRALEASFYVQGLATFSQTDMQKAGLSAAQAQIVVESLGVIAGDEDAHRQALTATIGALGGTVVDKCAFDFTAALTDPVSKSPSIGFWARERQTGTDDVDIACDSFPGDG